MKPYIPFTQNSLQVPDRPTIITSWGSLNISIRFPRKIITSGCKFISSFVQTKSRVHLLNFSTLLTNAGAYHHLPGRESGVDLPKDCRGVFNRGPTQFEAKVVSAPNGNNQTSSLLLLGYTSFPHFFSLFLFYFAVHFDLFLLVDYSLVFLPFHCICST